MPPTTELGGINSKHFGPPMWHSLSYIALGFDANPMPFKTKIQYYKQHFESYAHVLPCSHCRSSYIKFIEARPFESYVKTAMPFQALKWVYDIHEDVNLKLRRQEDLCYQEQIKAVGNMTALTLDQKRERLKAIADEIFYTQDTPPFEEFKAYYLQSRVDCHQPINQLMKSCRAINLPPHP